MGFIGTAVIVLRIRRSVNAGLIESEYFAAVAVHAGVLLPEYAPFIERARRKIPIGIWVGTNDALFPLEPVRATRDALNSHGFKAELTAVPRHTHRYCDRAADINRDVWAFLKKSALDQDPDIRNTKSAVELRGSDLDFRCRRE